ncbi:MAG TPA: energy transducer TonB [Paenirhodobacter sp.]
MKGWAQEFHGRGRRIGGVTLWATAAMVVVGAHAGGVALLMRHAPEPAAADSPEAALMMELSPVSEAANTDATNITDQVQDSQEVLQPETPPPPEPLPVEDEPPPLPDPEPEITEDIPDEIITPVEEAEVVIPKPEPRPRPQVEPEKKVVEKPRKERPKREVRKEPPSQAATAASAQVQQSQRNAAVESAAGAGSSAAPAKWRSRLMAHLEKRKRYPPASRVKREEGMALVTFTIDDAGNVLSASLSRSSGFAALDQEVVDMVRRASPVPVPPPGVSHTITAPVRFDLH